ncbi:hypothetical protein EP47_00115 [Legionella norrlandica]|uniref:Coiled-coil protein n=1 Tax=Legionella norrlandica TaxID=1498499 RepID=A0A0A2SU62_9GAMM|nr:hypothetical protein [Legionella norrlandica]KGP64292.1 hypothetical protein EP47_00115 [Legionella norrlandica]
MTIFLLVLKKLIKEKLSALSGSLDSKSKSLIHNRELSKDQKGVIDTLEEKITRFDGTNNDHDDLQKIIKKLEKARVSIQSLRESYSEPRDEGETISCLNNLRNHSTGFFDKLASFKFKLLDKSYSETPEYIVYYHAAVYLGDEIFTPKPGIDISIRNQKEDQVAKRLQSLSELIKSNYNLEEQRERALQVLSDLAADNKKIIKKDESSLPSFSLFWGASIVAPAELFSAREGRFGDEFNMANRRIKAMTEKQFKPSVIQQVEKKPELKQEGIKKSDQEHDEDEENSSQPAHTM